MKNNILAVALVMVFAAMPAHAGLNLPTLGKSKEAAPAADAPSGDALVTSFMASQALVTNAQVTLGTALGLKDELLQLQAQQKRLSSGQNDLDAMKKSREYSESTQKAIAASLAAQPELTSAQRAEFAKGLIHYGKALLGARDLLNSAQQFTASVGANPMTLMGKGKVALWVGKETPGYVKNLGASSRQLFEYARRNNIETPANATAALGEL